MAVSNGKPFAVITGASTGIGYHLARVFAQQGFDVFVTSEEDRLAEAVAELEELGVQVFSAQTDLATYEGVEELWRAVEATERPVDAIAINAGVGVGGNFIETSLEEELNLIALNVTSSVHLAKLALKQMVERSSGRVLFTSSIAAVIPTPLQAVYGASKSFLLSFARSLRHELKDTGVTVTALQPGATDTEFFHRAGMDNTEVGSEGKYENDPADVAQQGFDALMAGKDHIYAASMKTKIEGAVSVIVPESVKASQHKKMSEPRTGTEG